MSTDPSVRRLDTQEITTATDTREILANARRDTERYGLDDYLIVDVDSHHVELDSWPEILTYLDSPVMRDTAQQMMRNWPQASHLALHNHPPGLTMQDVSGRIPHQASLGEATPDTKSGADRDVTLVRRAMDAMSIDLQVVFPQPMLETGLHPQPEVATALLAAYNRWFTAEILPREPRIRTMLGLPFENPEACLATIEEFGDTPGVIGFLVTSQRHAGVHRNAYMPVYRELERRGLPIGFHAGPNQADTMTSTMNRFLSAHAMSFVTCNMTHMTNWVINGIPRAFSEAQESSGWRSGLAWLPFMMQRLDNEYSHAHESEAPLLKKMPSRLHARYVLLERNRWKWTDMIKLLKPIRSSQINAENTQLMYSSDYPHWDFDRPGRTAVRHPVPQRITAKRNILGETARKVFELGDIGPRG